MTPRDHILAAIDVMDTARRKAGFINLRPGMRPAAVTAQIEAVERDLRTALAELADARDAATRGAQRSLRAVGE